MHTEIQLSPLVRAHVDESTIVRSTLLLCALACSAASGATAQIEDPADTNAVKVYAVNRKVADFPDKEDMSTPEAAYATLNRLCASGATERWNRLSVSWHAQELPTEKREVPAEAARDYLGAELLEVQLWHETNGLVLARVGGAVDLRWLCSVDGQWLNEGEDVAPDLDEARELMAFRRACRDAKPLGEQAERLRNSRPPVADPEQYLRRFVQFLKRQATDPQSFLLRALRHHRLVILGEVHDRPRYWALNAALVRSPAFARNVGVIYLEWPHHDQPLMDRFLLAPRYDPAPLIDALRDMNELGWPDQPTMEFCQAVWEVNQTLPTHQRLRMVLVDKAEPWKEIHKREDWRRYEVDRNKLMARLIVNDLREHAQESRHALFIVGYMHAIKKATYPGGFPFKSAGWYLCRALGEKSVYAVFPHSPVLANKGGRVDGRLGLGLFETAFAALSNRPMAFPLDHGPFGDLLFDASLDFTTTDPYKAGFDAFLYLGPLEDEIMSPLIPGFYTDEYAREVDRRFRLMGGRGLASYPDIGEVSGTAIERWREKWWGQPRQEWQSLGPLNAWHYGSQWEEPIRQAKFREALKDPTVIRREAERLLTLLRQADYSQDYNTLYGTLMRIGYQVQTRRDTWVEWMARHFRTNPIVQSELGGVQRQPGGRPALPYKLVLKDGTTLEGVLPYEWSPNDGKWQGVEGLDWHLQK